MRYFEEYSQRVETHYPKVIKGLDDRGCLDTRTRGQLMQFVSNLLIRQVRFGNHFLMKIFEHPHVRSKLFNEITLFREDKDEAIRIFEPIESNISAKEQLNLLAGEIWNHLIRVFHAFKFVILKAPEGTCWFTSDNPVIIDARDNTEAWMIPPQSEIYFPITKKYLLFMYNHRVSSDNPICRFTTNEVTEAPPEIQHSIMMERINPSAKKFVVIGEDIGIMDIREE